MSEAQELGITPPPALGPPIIGTDPGSIAGEALTDFASGSATSPTAASWFPQAPVGTWLPPPQVGFGGNTPFTTPAVGPGVGPTYTVPSFATGSGTVPTVASLFPAFTAAGPSPPIVINAAQNTTTPIWVAPPALPLPTTPGTSPIPVGSSTAPNIPQLPWNPGPSGQPANTAPPTITGTTTTGSTLTRTTGTWTNSPTSYVTEWLRDGTIISGATGSTYVLVSADSGAMINVRVTAINASGEANADSAPVGPITGTLRDADVNVNLDADPDPDPDLPPRPRTTPKPATHRAPPHKRR